MYFATQAPKPVYFGPPPVLVEQGYTLGVEKLSMVAALVDPLVTTHWYETQPLPGDPCVDWGMMIEGERAGRIVLVTLRSAELQIVGYFIGNIHSPMAKSDTRVMTEMGFYVSPPHRLGMLGSKMMHYVHALAAGLDCKIVEMYSLNLRDGRNAGAVYKRLGYRPVAIQWIKEV